MYVSGNVLTEMSAYENISNFFSPFNGHCSKSSSTSEWILLNYF